MKIHFHQQTFMYIFQFCLHSPVKFLEWCRHQQQYDILLVSSNQSKIRPQLRVLSIKHRPRAWQSVPSLWSWPEAAGGWGGWPRPGLHWPSAGQHLHGDCDEWPKHWPLLWSPALSRQGPHCGELSLAPRRGERRQNKRTPAPGSGPGPANRVGLTSPELVLLLSSQLCSHLQLSSARCAGQSHRPCHTSDINIIRTRISCHKSRQNCTGKQLRKISFHRVCMCDKSSLQGKWLCLIRSS